MKGHVLNKLQKKAENRYDWQKIASRLQTLRKLKNLDMAEVVMATGISRTAYYNLEHVKANNLTLTTLGRLCELYGAQECDILHGGCPRHSQHDLISLDDDEISVLKHYRKISISDKGKAVEVIKAFAKSAGGDRRSKLIPVQKERRVYNGKK